MKKYYKIYDTETKQFVVNPMTEKPYMFVSQNQAKTFIAYLRVLGRAKGRYKVIDYDK